MLSIYGRSMQTYMASIVLPGKHMKSLDCLYQSELKGSGQQATGGSQNVKTAVCRSSKN